MLTWHTGTVNSHTTDLLNVNTTLISHTTDLATHTADLINNASDISTNESALSNLSSTSDVRFHNLHLLDGGGLTLKDNVPINWWNSDSSELIRLQLSIIHF